MPMIKYLLLPVERVIRLQSIGIVRKVDELGRIVLPKEVRKTFDINHKEPLEIFVDQDQIILQKYHSRGVCAVTGEYTPQNRKFGNGNIILSPKGIEILLNELESLENR